MTKTEASGAPDPRAISERLVGARLAATPLAEFPGPLPETLDAAYAVQAVGISLWPEPVAGWKVAGIGPIWRERYAEERLVGPIFRGAVRIARPGAVVDFPAFAGGFAAVEAEFVFRLRADAPPTKTSWSADEAVELVASLHAGVETAGSGLAIINDLGPGAVVADFGNNAGVIVGPEIPDWRRRPPEELTTETIVEGRSVGRGSAASVAGGPLAALAFALGRCARLGRPLRAGDVVSTGATTGVHDIRPGQEARLVFAGAGEIRCRAVPAQPVRAAAGELRAGACRAGGRC